MRASSISLKRIIFRKINDENAIKLFTNNLFGWQWVFWKISPIHWNMVHEASRNSLNLGWLWIYFFFWCSFSSRRQNPCLCVGVCCYLILLRTLFMTIFGCLLFLFRFFLPWFILLNENLANIFIIATFWFSFFLTQICFLWKPHRRYLSEIPKSRWVKWQSTVFARKKINSDKSLV